MTDQTTMIEHRADTRPSPHGMTVGARPHEVDLVGRVIALIDACPDETLSLQTLSDHVSMSPFHIQRVFKRATGMSPREYMESRRLERFKQHLRDGGRVSDALYNAGYGSSSRAYESAAEKMGMTPATYGRGGDGMEIVYAIVDCRLGRVLVASTERGVAAVHLGDPSAPDCDDELEAVLFDEYPLATLYRNRVTFCNWVDAIVQHINAGPLGGGLCVLDELPLDIRATAFQSRVWNEVRRIPFGETRTYGDIARAIGSPSAASAVAGAINANPVALLIPCHRAERADGNATGYYARRGKIVRENLLRNERVGVDQ